ncbi:hypothetical protein [Sinomonas mesophila]|uniref:hypothetical protein n=1 Tax=Sinomonas mesophila TaxID=1531955 RepID=UPI00098518A7|nr:hypothetical protein [Sinomonas mesophila]
MAGQVTATALGDWPGTDPLEAAKAIRGELGSPHLPFLAELPARGVGSDPVGRAASLLVDLHADVQPHGWRLVDRPGQDAQRAASALATDLNVLADVAGAEERPAEGLAVRVLGPVSLMAGLYVHSGERTLVDAGARRDIAQSLAAGLPAFLERVRRAVPGAALTVQLDEPDAARVLAGLVPTMSGYRTLRALPRSEARSVWTEAVEAIQGAGAEAIVALPAWEAPLADALASGADGVALPLTDLSIPQWEELAGAVEAGRRLWLGALPADGAPSTRTGELAERLVRPWRQLGLPFEALDAVRLTPAGSLAACTPQEATARLARVVKLADAVNQIALG